MKWLNPRYRHFQYEVRKAMWRRMFRSVDANAPLPTFLRPVPFDEEGSSDG